MWLATESHFWALLIQRGIRLHGMSMRDAALVAVQFMESAYPEEPKRMVEWRKLARSVRIPIVEDPALAAGRRRRQMAQLAADIGDDG